MSIMLTGGCKKCGGMCSTGLDSYLLERGEIVESPAVTTEIICYDCYDNYYSKEAIRDKKLNNLLTPWYKKLYKKLIKPLDWYFKYIGIKRIKNGI
mgnify:CR=1 FL=1